MIPLEIIIFVIKFQTQNPTLMKRVTLVIMLAIVAMLFASCKKENKLEQQIIGKWMTANLEGQAAPTNEKSAITFLSATEALMSSSRADYNPETIKWSAYLEYSVAIEGNKVTLTGHPNEHITLINEITIRSITATDMEGTFKHITLRDGVVTSEMDPVEMRWVKTTADYQETVLGLWECTELTGIETYNDANARLEFFADGIYNYWRKDEDGQWLQVVDREFQKYFVDGTLLATRWKVVGENELREWWEVASIAGDQMEWTALRKNEDGTTVQQGMKWVKVN